MTLTLEIYRPITLYNVPNLGFSDISSWLNADYPALAGISKHEAVYIFIASYQVALNVDLSFIDYIYFYHSKIVPASLLHCKVILFPLYSILRRDTLKLCKSNLHQTLNSFICISMDFRCSIIFKGFSYLKDFNPKLSLFSLMLKLSQIWAILRGPFKLAPVSI